MRTFALFGAKNFRFFEIYGVSADARTKGEGVEPVRTFFGQGEGGQFFVILCGRLLWLALMPGSRRPPDLFIHCSD